MSFLIGLDLSLTSTGVSVNGKTSVISTKARGAERLHIVSSAILDLCSSEKIVCAIIEGYSFASRNSQAHSIGEMGGAVRMKLWENGIPYVEVPPTCRAKFATGKGNAGKAEVISSISAITGIVWKGASADDMCDAWVLEEMVLTKLEKGKHNWPKESLLSLDKVDWTPLEEIENA